VKVSLARKQLIREVESQIRQNLGLFKSRARIQDLSVQGSIFSCNLKSLILTPLCSTGLITTGQVDAFEALRRRELLHLPRDIKSKVILNTTDLHHRGTCSIAESLAERARMNATL
jgi:hypothetical protein